MKKWEKPMVNSLNLSNTLEQYITYCDWNGAENLGLGNEDYTDPNNKPEKHPDWVWCTVHNRWHPKNHGGPGQS